MYYINFDEHITNTYGVVLDAWPLQKFAAPGSFNSLPVLTILYNAWQNGATRFRSLSDNEWDAWKKAHADGNTTTPVITLAADAVAIEDAHTDTAPTQADAPETTSTTLSTGADSLEAVDAALATAPTPIASASSLDAPPTRLAGQKRPFAEFFNAVAAPDGSGLQIPKKTRKVRSDKGKTRKKAPVSENAPPATS